MLMLLELICSAIFLLPLAIFALCIMTRSVLRALLADFWMVLMFLAIGVVTDTTPPNLARLAAIAVVMLLWAGGWGLIAAWRNPQCAQTLQKIFQPENSQ